LTYIGGVFTPHPTRQVIPMDGSQPVSAVPLNINMSGSSDLMVASSDGRIALLQAGDTGLQLTGLASPTGQTNITSIAGGDPINGGFQIYEASSNPDSVAILQFNLQDASVFGGEPAISLANTINVGDNSLVVELIPNGNAMLDLVGVLWTESTNSQVTEDPAMPRNTVGARSTAQGLLRSTNPEDSDSALVQASSGLLAEEDRDTEPGSTSWTRFVLGLDAAFDSVAREVAAVSESWTIPMRARLRETRGSKREGLTFGRPTLQTISGSTIELSRAPPNCPGRSLTSMGLDRRPRHHNSPIRRLARPSPFGCSSTPRLRDARGRVEKIEIRVFSSVKVSLLGRKSFLPRLRRAEANVKRSSG